MILGKQFKQMQKDKDIPGISCGLVRDNVFDWEVMLMINDDCKLYGGTQLPALQQSLGLDLTTDTGGCFRARLSFPKDYPHMPPKMKFETPIYHPNSESAPDMSSSCATTCLP